MSHFTRRRALRFGLFGCATAILQGCGGSSESDQSPAPAPATPSPTAPSWNVNPAPYFVTGSGATYDLAATLPVGVVTGGNFAVSTAGAPLPAGMTLSSAGMLSVGTSNVAQASGVIFSYTEPGT